MSESKTFVYTSRRDERFGTRARAHTTQHFQQFNGTFHTMLVQQLGIIRAAGYNNVCIMGDFNYKGIDWNRLTGDGNAEEFLNVLQDGFYH